jgi:transposase
LARPEWCPWRYLPKDCPPWERVSQQTRRWPAAGCFEAIVVPDLRAVLRFAAGREPEPTAAILDSHTIQSTPESGGRAGSDGSKRRQRSKVHAAVDTLGHLLVLHITPANEQDREQVGVLAEATQEVTGESVELAYVDQGDTGEESAGAAADRGIAWEVVKLPEAKRGFVLLHGVGSWSGRSVGRRDSAVWRRITSGSARRSPGCTTSRSAS